MPCDCQCSVVHPNGAVSWSAVCECNISCPYSLTFGAKRNINCVEQVVSCAIGFHGAHHLWLQKSAALPDVNVTANQICMI